VNFENGERFHHGWDVVGLVIWIGLWATLAIVGFFVVRQLMSRRAVPAIPQGYGPSRSAALDELDLRYARGEIARDEYLGRRADLLATTGFAWPGGPQYAAPAQPSGPAPQSQPPGAPPAPPAAGSPGAPPAAGPLPGAPPPGSPDAPAP
jgi:uncharacterized membrane protein